VRDMISYRVPIQPPAHNVAAAGVREADVGRAHGVRVRAASRTREAGRRDSQISAERLSPHAFGHRARKPVPLTPRRAPEARAGGTPSSRAFTSSVYVTHAPPRKKSLSARHETHAMRATSPPVMLSAVASVFRFS